jgi:hypothetical protein
MHVIIPVTKPTCVWLSNLRAQAVFILRPPSISNTFVRVCVWFYIIAENTYAAHEGQEYRSGLEEVNFGLVEL